MAEVKIASEEVFRLDSRFHVGNWSQFRRIDPAVQERAVKIWNELVTS